MKIVVISNYPESIVSFRGALLKKFAAAGHNVVVCAPGERRDIAGQLRGMGVSYRSVGFDRTGMNPLHDAWAVARFIRLFREFRPDIVLLYTIKPVIYGSIAAWFCSVTRIYSVITGLGYLFTGNSWKQRMARPVARALYRTALARNNMVFFLNRDDLHAFSQYGIIRVNGAHKVINGEGIDLDHYSVRFAEHSGIEGIKGLRPSDASESEGCRSEGTSPGRCISFLMIARLLKDKGVTEFAEAARNLKGRYHGVTFRLVGPLDSNPTAISRAEVDQWRAEGSVVYLGETADVRPFIAASSVFVLPSYREGLPRTVLEAMSMGRPVITTDAPGCREPVIDGDNGFLVPVRDSGALAMAMERFIREPELIERMGLRSRQIAEETYDVRKVNAEIIQAMGLENEEAH